MASDKVKKVSNIVLDQIESNHLEDKDVIQLMLAIDLHMANVDFSFQFLESLFASLRSDMSEQEIMERVIDIVKPEELSEEQIKYKIKQLVDML